jgi:AraC-like DNA-binding protein
MTNPSIKESAVIWRAQGLPGLELLKARYVNQTFARHSHEGYALGVIESGALGFDYRGSHVVAPAGAINMAVPDEPHTGEAAVAEGWSYRMFYLETALLKEAASQMEDRPGRAPFFKSGVVHDPRLADVVRRLHQDLEQGHISLLAGQSRLLGLLAAVINRHASEGFPLKNIGREPGPVRRARDYLEACYRENVSLDDLSRAAYLSPFHLIRVFRRETGLTPHAYLNQVRINRGKVLLAQGWTIAAAALETGFVDQSHLTRQFKRLLGVTPGQYRRAAGFPNPQTGPIPCQDS